jgi:glycosidase
MTYVGTPHIWYGNEVGMMGGHDPDCRRPFNWQYKQNDDNVDLRKFYKKMIDIRKRFSSLRTGNYNTIITDGMVYGYKREDEDSKIIVLINNDTKINKVKIPVNAQNLLELISEQEYIIKDGIFEIELDAMSGLILKEKE